MNWAFVLTTLSVVAVSLSALIAAAPPATPFVQLAGSNGKIAFASDRDGNYEIYVTNADGTNPIRLTMNQAEDFDPAWSPDGTKLAFISDRDGNQEIYVMNADGSNQTRLTSNSAGEFDPTWSPDGSKLAFTSDRDSNEEIYVMSATGGGQTNLTQNEANDAFPAWSPDGAKLAFTSDRDIDFEIYLMGADGGNQTNVSRNDADDAFPAWSPDGAQLAFASDRNGRYEIYLMNADGGNQMRLSGSSREETVPAWSPDGTKLVFMAGDLVGGQIINNDIFVISAAGSGRTNITNNSADDIYPDWQRLTATPTPTPMPASVQFGQATYSFSEGAGSALITVTRTGDTSGAATVNYMTIDDPAAIRCDVVNGTAYARCDYATTVDTLRFAAGEMLKTFAISLINDAHVEGNETFQLRLSEPAGVTLGTQNTATVTITDNDTVGAANPILTTPFFVRQHYLDFLSREPEAGEPWSAILNNCPDPFNLDPRSASAQCDRILVSSSFFGSPEFRLKGFYVFIHYRVAFDRLADYSEIVSDMRSVTGQTPADTSARRAQFPVSFTQRAEFRQRFDALSDTAFVAALLDRYGLQSVTTPDPANPEGGAKVTLTRADLVSRLGSGALTRAQVLRTVVESDEVSAAEFNRAFVAMQYYGYLRRTPEPGGFNDWLDAIGRRGESPRVMVNGFMNSQEYRLRFGQP
ncbi:hypothetical protein BH18ACI2_BH18ACI2_07000 [soil metagenome]